ncbi:MAG: hypothetical protein ACE5JG_06595, partial [Planctomycetota bacterium]
ADALARLDAHFDGGAAPPAAAPGRTLLDLLKDEAARTFDVERSLLDERTKRRLAGQARRAVMAVAVHAGLEPAEIAASLGLRAARTVTEACRRIDAERLRDPRLDAILDRMRRVLPGG